MSANLTSVIPKLTKNNWEVFYSTFVAYVKSQGLGRVLRKSKPDFGHFDSAGNPIAQTPENAKLEEEWDDMEERVLGIITLRIDLSWRPKILGKNVLDTIAILKKECIVSDELYVYSLFQKVWKWNIGGNNEAVVESMTKLKTQIDEIESVNATLAIPSTQQVYILLGALPSRLNHIPGMYLSNVKPADQSFDNAVSYIKSNLFAPRTSSGFKPKQQSSSSQPSPSSQSANKASSSGSQNPSFSQQRKKWEKKVETEPSGPSNEGQSRRRRGRGKGKGKAHSHELQEEASSMIQLNFAEQQDSPPSPSSSTSSLPAPSAPAPIPIRRPPTDYHRFTGVQPVENGTSQYPGVREARVLADRLGVRKSIETLKSLELATRSRLEMATEPAPPPVEKIAVKLPNFKKRRLSPPPPRTPPGSPPPSPPSNQNPEIEALNAVGWDESDDDDSDAPRRPPPAWTKKVRRVAPTDAEVEASTSLGKRKFIA